MSNTKTTATKAASAGVQLQTVASVLIFGAAMAPMVLVFSLSGFAGQPNGVLWLGIGAVVSAVLSATIARMLTWKLRKLSELMSAMARPQSVEDMLKIEREMISLGGAKELRSSSAAIRKVVYALVRSSKAARAKQ